MPTTTIIRTSTTSATGYELVVKDELGNESIQPIQSTYKNEPYTLVLPENPAGRKYMNSKKVDAAGGEIELVQINRNPDAERTYSKKSLLEYMTPEDKELYEAIMERARKAREEANKKVPLTEEEKLRNKIAKLQAQLEAELKKEAQA